MNTESILKAMDYLISKQQLTPREIQNLISETLKIIK